VTASEKIKREMKKSPISAILKPSFGGVWGGPISRLSPESLNVVDPDGYREIWQVFWLGAMLKPSRLA
jgi:hypothetical protein